MNQTFEVWIHGGNSHTPATISLSRPLEPAHSVRGLGPKRLHRLLFTLQLPYELSTALDTVANESVVTFFGIRATLPLEDVSAKTFVFTLVGFMLHAANLQSMLERWSVD